MAETGARDDAGPRDDTGARDDAGARDDTGPRDDAGPREEREPEPAGHRGIDAREAAGRAAEYVDEMTGAPPEVVTAVERQDGGWLVRVEVLELARVPATTDVLANYEVELSADGEPGSYRRIRRYHRGRVGREWT